MFFFSVYVFKTFTFKVNIFGGLKETFWIMQKILIGHTAPFTLVLLTLYLRAPFSLQQSRLGILFVAAKLNHN